MFRKNAKQKHLFSWVQKEKKSSSYVFQFSENLSHFPVRTPWSGRSCSVQPEFALCNFPSGHQGWKNGNHEQRKLCCSRYTSSYVLLCLNWKTWKLQDISWKNCCQTRKCLYFCFICAVPTRHGVVSRECNNPFAVSCCRYPIAVVVGRWLSGFVLATCSLVLCKHHFKSCNIT